MPLVRSFSARRWVSGLAERLGRAGKPVERLADALPDGASLSLALHDERVILANRIDVRRAPAPLLRDRGGPAVVTLVLPAYEATRTIPEVAAEIPVDAADRALLVDDASHDATAEVALAHGFDVIRHPANRGYGGGQKTGYARALLDGADVDRHGPRRQPVRARARAGDGGADPRRARPTWSSARGCCATARSRAACRAGSGWATACSPASRTAPSASQLSEYHTGYRAFSADLLRSIPFLRNSDDFVFDQEIFAQVLARDARVVEIPIPTRYFREASSVDLRTSVRYGADDARRARALHGRSPARGRWPLLRRTGRRPRRPAPVAMRAPPASACSPWCSSRRGARAAHRATSTPRPATPCATTRSTTTSTRARSPQGDGFSKTLAHGRPTAFRPPGYPYFLGAVYHVFKADRKPAKERVHVARIAQAFVGAALVALVGVIAAQLWGSIAALVALGLARDLPAADPRRRGGDVRAAVRRLHARLAGGRARPTGARAIATRGRWLAGVARRAWPPSPGPRP